jgi:hypothetical protein
MTPQTNIRIDKVQADRSKKIRAKAKGAQIGGFSFRNRKPSHTEIYCIGLNTFETEMKKGK